MKIGIINVSDRASQGVYEDIPGKRTKELLQETINEDVTFEYAVVPDEVEEISKSMIAMADEKKCNLIISTGGTGPAPRDVTPEATEKVIEKALPGFGEAMRMESLAKVPTSILSRQVAGIRGSSLIVNLPGKPKAIGECLEIIMPAVPYCVQLIGGPKITLELSALKQS
ncbi:MAG: molybdopterin adenylyltransferase [Opitutales bacterium]|nr:molybdopterin adenylyltransferase [Opitutales bacterium]